MEIKEALQFLKGEKIAHEFMGDDCSVLNKVVGWSAFEGEGLTFYSGKNPDELKPWKNEKNGLIITSSSFQQDMKNGPFVFVDAPKVVFMMLANLMVPVAKSRIHPTAIIHTEAKIGKDFSIGAYSVIGKVSIGDNCKIGNHVSIQDNTLIGNNVKILSGCMIGEPGLGSEVGMSEQQITFPHFAGVEIQDNVVIGTNTVINCGAMEDTIIGENTHISSNCLVAHNCELGKGVYLAACASIAGSVKIGARSYIGFGACIKEGVVLGEEITVGIQITVQKNYTKQGITLINASIPKEIGSIFTLKRTFNK